MPVLLFRQPHMPPGYLASIITLVSSIMALSSPEQWMQCAKYDRSCISP